MPFLRVKKDRNFRLRPLGFYEEVALEENDILEVSEETYEQCHWACREYFDFLSHEEPKFWVRLYYVEALQDLTARTYNLKTQKEEAVDVKAWEQFIVLEETKKAMQTLDLRGEKYKVWALKAWEKGNLIDPTKVETKKETKTEEKKEVAKKEVATKEVEAKAEKVDASIESKATLQELVIEKPNKKPRKKPTKKTTKKKTSKSKK